MLLHYLKYIIEVMLSPNDGWKDVGEDDTEPVRLLSGGYYPLLGIEALIVLVFGLLYGNGIGRSLTGAIILFGSYFGALFVAKLVLNTYIPKIGGISDRNIMDRFAIVILGLMSIFSTLVSVLPWHLLIINFLPFYGALVAAAPGARDIMWVPAKNYMRFLLVSICATIAAPLVIYNLFYLLLP